MKTTILMLLILSCTACSEGSEVNALTMAEATELCRTRGGVTYLVSTTLSLSPAIFIRCGNGQKIAFSTNLKH